jgi:hypothetical protein
LRCAHRGTLDFKITAARRFAGPEQCPVAMLTIRICHEERVPSATVLIERSDQLCTPPVSGNPTFVRSYRLWERKPLFPLGADGEYTDTNWELRLW